MNIKRLIASVLVSIALVENFPPAHAAIHLREDFFDAMSSGVSEDYL